MASNPVLVDDRLAVYTLGQGKPILLMPCPHAQITCPSAYTELADSMISIGRQVVTFDPPGSFASPGPTTCKLDEMIESARIVRDTINSPFPIDVIGHSMAAFCALAWAIESPKDIDRLILIGGLSGFPAAARWGLPGSFWHWTDKAYWRCIFRELRLIMGLGSLALHKQHMNDLDHVRYFDQSLATPVPIDPGDVNSPVPTRVRWSYNLFRRLDYSKKLHRVRSRSLICVGRYDYETPLACAQQLADGIPSAQLEIFPYSGHCPFIEEPSKFESTIRAFLEQDYLEANLQTQSF